MAQKELKVVNLIPINGKWVDWEDIKDPELRIKIANQLNTQGMEALGYKPVEREE